MSQAPPPVSSSWLPPLNSTRYYVMLGLIAIFILGPLGGVTAAYMNFSLGFFVGGQVLAGILGSAVTYGYGSEGKHGANYMQTMAASVASMAGMAVLIQAMVWLGLPQPPAWQLAAYFLCIGMFGVGVGMLYTPILVDRMQLTFPSGFAVANILRALTDKNLLQVSIGKLGSGTVLGLLGGIASMKLASIGNLGISTSTIGAGMVVGARIAVPGMVIGLLGEELTPWLVKIKWLDEGAPFRKIGFILALGTILGAAIVDLSLIAYRAVKEFGAPKQAVAPGEEWKQTNTLRLVLWVVAWGAALVFMATQVLNLPLLYVAIAIGLVFIFLVINGISTGISDSNPISSAFVISVFVMAFVGLTDPGTGLMCAAILLIATSIGVDMQQDRSTGWRLGTNRVIQFRYQVIGVFMGAIMAVLFAKVFMAAYPVLEINQFDTEALKLLPPETLDAAKKWQSAMTYKFVGALGSLTSQKPHIMLALQIGIAAGLFIELVRKVVKSLDSWQRFATGSKVGFATDFVFDAFLFPSPYASSFGGFVDFTTTVWFAAGGVLTSFAQTVEKEARAPFERRAAAARAAAVVAATPDDPPAQPGDMSGHEAVPEDMSTTSLVGGGLIAGDSLAALGVGIYGLLQTVL